MMHFPMAIVSPQAIKDFLSYAYENWTPPAPKYVLIVGDATYDVKDNWGAGSVTYVPSYLTFTEYLGETASDQWFVQISGQDALPDMSIGRLPANSVAEATAMVNKIIAYDQADNTKSWEKAVLLVADNQIEEFEAVFETMNEEAAALIPAAMDTPSRFYLEEYEQELLSVEDLTDDLVNSLNTGALVLNYSGHAGYSTLAIGTDLGQPRLCQSRGLRAADQRRQIPAGDLDELHGRILRLPRALDSQSAAPTTTALPKDSCGRQIMVPWPPSCPPA